jgi:Domain of unknown function (DUF1840)
MLYKFKSKAAGDVIMLKPNGDQVLGLIGREPAAKGIIEVAAMPAAIAALEQAVAADEARRAQSPPPADSSGRAEAEGADEKGVSLRQRAWPLVEMLRRSLAEKQDIVWGV